MQLQFVRKLIGMYVERIVGKVFPNETGAARLQQVGLFTLIFALEEGDVPVTTARLSKMTGQSRSKVHLQLQKLVKVGVVEQKKALNRHGRGQVLFFDQADGKDQAAGESDRQSRRQKARMKTMQLQETSTHRSAACRVSRHLRRLF
jgi:predicted transcriptional regulator